MIENHRGRAIALPAPPPPGAAPAPTHCTKIIYIWRLFGARVDVNSNLVMHALKPVFSIHTQISVHKNLHRGRGIPPSHTLPPLDGLYLWSLELELMLI